MSNAALNPPSVVVNTASNRQQVPLRDYLNARIAPFLKKAITESLNAEAEFPLQWLGECLIHQSILYEGNTDRTNIRERFLYKFEDPKPQEPADTSAAAPAPASAPVPEPAPAPESEPAPAPESEPAPAPESEPAPAPASPRRSPSAQPEPTSIPSQEPPRIQPEITMNEAIDASAEQQQPPQPTAEDAAPQAASVTEEPAVNGVKDEGEAREGEGARNVDVDTEMGGTS
ncbi:hypothetical protein Z517_02626 [Fonsecaea pedrosoi CBS 271.37]|uniref:Uncharacterized protein n=1 Tax=Fonsecaea pedrosoi CBS 271.37 TaxID=1442368 RepID=A0A0D2E031_9EURO|nr:uncharacterized protein Z517_02626 [Fonsecaea pedrosoi CBS 271.37]KIW83381.1 hypothetical protein Z517_02626 [Fonsecaea pedrosoi CBS 271.37]